MTTATKSKSMFSTRNDLAREVRANVIDLLNQQLADTWRTPGWTMRQRTSARWARRVGLRI